jgi:hypothetical protein
MLDFDGRAGVDGVHKEHPEHFSRHAVLRFMDRKTGRKEGNEQGRSEGRKYRPRRALVEP